MPLSKRAKKVSLTKTAKREPSEKRSGYVEGLRSCIEERSSVYLVRIDDHARPTLYKALRKALPAGSRLFLGKKSLMQVSLGRTKEEEVREGLHHLADLVEGGMGLVVTDESRPTIESVLEDAKTTDFATAGFVATTSLRLERGPLAFPSPMIDTLKKLGMPVEVKESKLELVDGYVAATGGVPLTPEQAKLLKHLDIKLATFAPSIVAGWVDGQFIKG